ncbi:uncharacterized protein BDR25DRAFT_347387 [Lindgomyces ingoldianus]|uniref:Uncharacterized protein n=1 Tax=Lindgomyces ingoldianus TaxID=673940 RepID=A0ACB6Q8E9_9PLEO|nr:uncharacterized protein BDR25DRAFT_347387 [Lindgomyces ingoldianus]KAF2463171.1 hypothetical protein BDR25DRAFT_347387 [Lindgomyces ingoldianus]
MSDPGGDDRKHTEIDDRGGDHVEQMRGENEPALDDPDHALFELPHTTTFANPQPTQSSAALWSKRPAQSEYDTEATPGPSRPRFGEESIEDRITAIGTDLIAVPAQQQTAPRNEPLIDFETTIETTMVNFFGRTKPPEKIRKSIPTLFDEPLGPLQDPLGKKEQDIPIFRWIHLPANNMVWVETLVKKIYAEQRQVHTYNSDENPEDMWEANQRSLAEYLLAPQRWTCRQYDNPEGSPGARFMKPLLAKIRKSNVSTTDWVVFMPYLHWENFSAYRRRLQSIDAAVEEIDLERRSQPSAEILSPYTTAKWKRQMAMYQMQKFRRGDVAAPPSTSGKAPTDPSGKRAAIQAPGNAESNLIRKYLDYRGGEFRVKGGRIEDNSPLLLQPLHLRRTLDRSYYYTLEDHEIRKRDVDQVLYRHTYDELELYDPMLIMVDQLWLWVIDDRTIVTAFPQRSRIDSELASPTTATTATTVETGPTVATATTATTATTLSAASLPLRARGFVPPLTPTNPTKLAEEFYRDFNKPTRDESKHSTPEPNSVFTAAPDKTDVRERILSAIQGDHKDIDTAQKFACLVMDKCSGVFFPEASEEDDLLDFLDVFAISIARLAFNQAQAFNDFCEDSRRPSNRKKYQLPNNPSDKELRKRVEHHQTCPNCKKTAVDKFWYRSEDSLHPEGQSLPDQEGRTLEHSATPRYEEDTTVSRKQKSLVDISEETEYVKEIKDILDELNSMARVFEQQKDILKNRNPTNNDDLYTMDDQTLDLIYVQGRVSERLDKITQLQNDANRVYSALRDLLDLKQKQASVKQTDDTAQQGLTILVFTIVTIFFSPLGFVAAIFSMNASEINGTQGRPLSHIWRIMFPVTVAVLILSLLLAFAINPVMNSFSKAMDRIWQLYTKNLKWQQKHLGTVSSPSSGSSTARDDTHMSGGLNLEAEDRNQRWGMPRLRPTKKGVETSKA